MNLNFFLTMKHWQLFLLLIGIPFAIQSLAIMFWLESFVGSDMIIQAIPYFIVLVSGLFFGWFYAVGTQLHAKLPESAPMSLPLFRTMLAIPALLVLSIDVFTWLLVNDRTEIFRNMDENYSSVFLILYLGSLFALFYLLYFVARCLVSVEEQAPVSFSAYSGPFFALFFFPLGIWFFQPRINAIFDKNNNDRTLRYDNIIDTF